MEPAVDCMLLEELLFDSTFVVTENYVQSKSLSGRYRDSRMTEIFKFSRFINKKRDWSSSRSEAKASGWLQIAVTT